MATEGWRNLLLAPTLTPEALRDVVLAALGAADGIASVHASDTDPLRLEARTRDGRTMALDLGNLFADASRSAPAERLRFVESALAASLASALVGDAPATREQLVPIVQSVAWLRATPTPELAKDFIAGDLIVAYAFERAHAFTYARIPDLVALHLSPAETASLAKENLRKRLPQSLDTRGDGRSFMLVAGGNYEASLLLLDEIWDQFAQRLPGQLVACVPARDVCLVSSTQTAGGIESLMTARNRVWSSGPAHAISTTILVRADRKWVVADIRGAGPSA